MPDVPDMPAYLEARWAEEDAAALAADVRQGDPQWKVNPVLAGPGHYTVRSAGSNRPIARVEDVGDDDPDDPASGPQSILVGADVAAHIACWGPARVLADLTAKRAILDRHRGRGYPNPDDDPIDVPCSSTYGDWNPVPDGECRELLALAQPYANRPDFPDEWRT